MVLLLRAHIPVAIGVFCISLPLSLLLTRSARPRSYVRHNNIVRWLIERIVNQCLQCFHLSGGKRINGRPSRISFVILLGQYPNNWRAQSILTVAVTGNQIRFPYFIVGIKRYKHKNYLLDTVGWHGNIKTR